MKWFVEVTNANIGLCKEYLDGIAEYKNAKEKFEPSVGVFVLSEDYCKDLSFQWWGYSSALINNGFAEILAPQSVQVSSLEYEMALLTVERYKQQQANS